MSVILFESEMPTNTGNTERICVAMNTKLHLIEPLGSKVNKKVMRRADLDYQGKLGVTVYSDYQESLERSPGAKIYMTATKAQKVYTEVECESNCLLMFGERSTGIPEEILVESQETCARIPMWGGIRLLNLSDSMSIVLYEALRQNGFEKMTMEGDLHRLHWR